MHRTPPSPAPARPRGAIGTEWELLTSEINGCTRCPLHRERTHAVVYRGGPHPSVVFVGEAPGRDEDRVGRPFVGRSGRALDRAIAAVDLTPDEVGIVNLIKCRPPENRFDPAAAATCRVHLDRQLALLGPVRIVTLGRHALRTLAPTAPAITEAAGHEQLGSRGPIFALLHPAAPMHAPRLAVRWEQDLALLREWLRTSSTQTS